jgi:DNA-binding IclR family transcriptional regulator
MAIDREELVAGVCCVATPVYAPGGKAVAALCVLTDPSPRLTKLTNLVLHAGRVITATLQQPRSAAGEIVRT